MLVSLMTRLSASRQKSDAQYAIMRNRMNMISMSRNMPSFFGFGYGNMAALERMETDMMLDNIKNETLYMLASEQEKAAQQMMAQERRQNSNHLSYMA